MFITRGPRSIEAFKEIDVDDDKALTKEEVNMQYCCIMNLLFLKLFTYIVILDLQIKEYLKMEAKKLNSQKDESYFDDVVADVFQKNDHNADGTLSLNEYNVYGHDEL